MKRDYYADLELPYGASADEVKKQFRRLAKIYHPDRNPGREVDFISKFQAIQAANEVLTDPEQKLKYDQDRRKQGYVVPKATNAPRTNVNNFPPPPRRANTAARDGKAYNAGGVHKAPPSAGAQRYAGWARASAQEWQNAKEEAQSRADAFRGFSEMKSGPARGFPPPPPQRGRFVPTAQRPATSHAPSQANAPKAANGWEQFPSGQAGFPGMSRTQSTRRKQGFDPSTPSGDEHMAGTSAYSGVRRGKQPQASTADASYFDPRGSPISPEDISRSPTSPLRHTRSHDDASATRPGLNRQSTKYARSGGEKTDLFGSGLGRSASVRSSRVDPGDADHDTRRPRSYQGGVRFHSASPPSRTAGFSATYSDESSSSESSSGEDIDASERPKATPRVNRFKTSIPPQGQGFSPNMYASQPGKAANYKYPPPPERNAPFFPNDHSTTSQAQTEDRSGDATETTDTSGPSFSTSQNGSANVSTDHLKAFSASEWDGKFRADAFAPMPNIDQDRKSPSKTSRRGTAQSRMRGNSPGKTADTNGAADPATTSNTSSTFQPARFDADKWREHLNDQTWATPPPDVGHSWDRKRNIKSNGTTKKSNYPKPPTSVPEAGNSTSASVNGVPVSEPTPKSTIVDEMDIDEPQVSSSTADASSRESDVNNASRPDSKTASVNLGDLGQVHPIKPSSAGLGDFDDLSSTLPFESRAAPSVNLEGLSASLSRVKDLNLPRPPKAPIAPTEESLSPGRWIVYVNAMATYMKEWSRFNKQILEHFAIRQAQLDHNMANNWISSVGDGPTDVAALERRSGSQAGYKTYMTWVEQDEAVRKWWDVCCERHRTAMMELGFVREKMKAGNKSRAA